MSKPASKTLIGAFVLGAIALLGIAIVVLGSGKFFANTLKAVCFFDGSVGGLDVGAPVLFNGVKIGSVTGLVLRYDPKALTTTIPVYIEIDPRQMETIGPPPKSFEKNLSLLIDQGLRARLELQSIITGKLQVELGYHPDKPANFLSADENYLEIPTIPTSVQEIAKRIEQLPLEESIKDISTAVAEINRAVPEINQMARSVALAAEETKSLMQNLNSRVEPVSEDLRHTLQQTQKLLQKIDKDSSTLTSSIDGTVKDVHNLVENLNRQIGGPSGPSIQRTLSSIEKTSEEASILLRQTQETLLGGHMGADSELMYELKKAVKEVASAAKALRGLAEALEQQPDSLLFGRKKR
jgi:paraquat-inducible protein B